MSRFSVDYEALSLLVQEVKEYAIFVLDPEGRILTWNEGAQRLNGYTAEEAIGQSFAMFYEAVDLANNKPLHLLGKALVEGRVEDEGWRLRKDGSRFWANVVLTTLHDREGRIRGFAKISRDMTDDRSAQNALFQEAVDLEQRVQERTAELEKANRLKDEFVSTLSHELRTPLTSIVGWIGMLQAGNLTGPQKKKAFEVVNRNLIAQAKLTDDLLEVARIVNGTVKIDMQPGYPGPLIKEAIDSFRPTVIAKKLKLTCELDAKLGPISIDAARFHQIIWNLLTNAVKFTQKGRIHIALKRHASHAVIRISDSGEGIDPEVLPSIFDRFRQADGSISRKHGGLGVGLTIVKNLVELHGGTIQAESVGIGEGSTFTVSFPIPALASKTPSVRKLRLNQRLTVKGVRVLVIDDDVDTREMIAQALELRGAKVAQADSAKKALYLLEKAPSDLIISDIGMPGMDGYAFIRTLRSIESPNSKLPAAALSGYAADEDRKRSIEAGFNAHVAKPISIDKLLRVIDELMVERAKRCA